MHPTFVEHAARAHQDELRRRAGHARGQRRSRRPTGERLGWVLVAIGLRLAVGRSAAPGDRIDWSCAA